MTYLVTYLPTQTFSQSEGNKTTKHTETIEASQVTVDGHFLRFVRGIEHVLEALICADAVMSVKQIKEK